MSTGHLGLDEVEGWRCLQRPDLGGLTVHHKEFEFHLKNSSLF